MINKKAHYAFITLFIIGMIIIAAIVITRPKTDEIQSNCQINPQAQPMSDEEYMRTGVIYYLESDFDTNFPKPDYDVSLEDIAVDNAVKGNNLWIPVAGNTAEEALKTLISVDGTYTCGQASFWLDTNQRDFPHTKYAVGVYKTSYNQYNISIVIKRQNPDTQEMNRNGAFVTVEHDPSVINFKPPCFYLRKA